MEELYELRNYLEAGQYKEALTLLDELEEMGRDDKINKRRKTGGWCLTEDELSAALEETFDSALDNAALEIFEGRYSPEEVAAMIDRPEILRLTLRKICAGR